MTTFVERRKRVEAIQYTGDNYEQVRRFVEETIGLVSAFGPNIAFSVNPHSYAIQWGEEIVLPSDWLLIDSNGKGYVASDEKFGKLYEEVK